VANPNEMRLPALQVRQGPRRSLYSFAVEGKQLPLFTTVSRIRRNEAHEIEGYQRPEVLAHIASIRRYIESTNPMIPNALVIAFDSRVRFEPAAATSPEALAQAGTLIIPVTEGEPDTEKPGWIVDGQQRAAALRDANVESFPICVTAFVTDDDAEQRAQFILVNSTKPLPKGLIHELLPATTTTLPIALQTRRFPASLLNRLNYDEDSPLREMIHTPTTPKGIIKDNSILRMLENSLSDGALYRYRDRSTGEGDTEAMLNLLKAYWRAVERTFPDAWGQPPRRSRLMHGVGIISLGFLMDAITDRYSRRGIPTEKDFLADLAGVRDICRWTHGHWELGAQARRKWNELQNTPKDIQLLTNYILYEYKARVWSKPLDLRRDA
jgi:DGQHR domain-containing protein